MISSMRRVQQIEGGWRILARATLLMPRVALGLRLHGFQRTGEWLGLKAGQSGAPQNMDFLRRAQEITLLVNGLAARIPIATTCLTRSLVLWRLLRAEGIDGQLYIGVRTTQTVADPLLAHAWVECNGHVLNDSPDVHTLYRPIATFAGGLKDSI